ncbi:MAG: deoxyribose-phosphate aldolase [Treponema sp.]|nr:deoxyribose-phosphate aldolase [Treponema sp.]
MTKEEIAGMIDHTILAPNIKKHQVEKLCREADQNHFASVCVNPIFVSFAADLLQNSSVKVCTVIGFPLGAVPTENKAAETKTAIKNGAHEVDMVIDLNAALEGDFEKVQSDISGVVEAARSCDLERKSKTTVKVILETCYLDDDTIRNCCIAAKNAGADFVKTSTGFGTPKDKDGKSLPNGASAHHVKLMRETVGPNMGVKASGGIRTAESAREMVEAGASRIGTSSGIAILESW